MKEYVSLKKINLSNLLFMNVVRTSDLELIAIFNLLKIKTSIYRYIKY